MKMSPFKNFISWLGWYADTHLGLFLVLEILAFGFMLLFVLSLVIPLNLEIKITSGALFFLLLFVFVAGASNTYKSNFRVAIESAKKFKDKHTKTSGKIDEFIKQTQETKDPTQMNGWINNYEALIEAKEKLQNLTQKLTIELPAEIKETKKEVLELQQKVN